jgi:hypothetical protein
MLGAVLDLLPVIATRRTCHKALPPCTLEGQCDQPMAANLLLWDVVRNAYRTFSGRCSWNPGLDLAKRLRSAATARSTPLTSSAMTWNVQI